MELGELGSCVEKGKIWTTDHTKHQVNSKCIKDLNVKKRKRKEQKRKNHASTNNLFFLIDIMANFEIQGAYIPL